MGHKILTGYTKESLKILWEQYGYKEKFKGYTYRIKPYGVDYALYLIELKGGLKNEFNKEGFY